MRTLLLTLVTGAALAGCGGTEDSAVQLVDFRAGSGTDVTEILKAGDLTLEAGCIDAAGAPVLTVGARTAVDDAAIASVYRQKRSGKGGYQFTVGDFDRDDGAWDFLGSGNHEVTGTLEYSSAGGHVSVSFFADEDETEGACVLSGTAISAAA